MMLLETENYLPNQLLRDTDQMSMAHSLEVRVPLLDDSVVRVALALPASVRTAAGKRILVAAAGGPMVAKRPFALPFDAWLRGPLHEPVREALLSEDLPFAKEVPRGSGDTYGGTSKRVGRIGAVPGPWRFCGSGRERTTSDGECVRVLITVPSLDRSFGGPAVKVGQLASALRGFGLDVRVVGCGSGQDALGLPILFRYHGTPVPRSVRPLARLVHHADIVHILGFRDPLGTAAALTARRAACRTCWSRWACTGRGSGAW